MKKRRKILTSRLNTWYLILKKKFLLFALATFSFCVYKVSVLNDLEISMTLFSTRESLFGKL